MTEKIKLYDDSKCTACRGCQLACKQWNALKAVQTENRGTYQNPPSLAPNTFMLIHFQDYVDEEGQHKMVVPQGSLHALHRCGLCDGLSQRRPAL